MVRTSNKNKFGSREYALSTRQLYVILLTKRSILGKTPEQRLRYLRARANEIPEKQIVKGMNINA